MSLGNGPNASVAVGRDFLDAFEVVGVVPDPERVAAGPEDVVFTFARRPPAQATFTLQPSRPGLRRATLRGPDGTVRFRQLVYP